MGTREGYGAVGNVVIEGKTKVVYNLPEYENGKYVLLQSKDQITCGDGARKDILEGKGALSNATNGAVFEFLNQSGVRTHFHKSLSETECIVEHCDMIPLEVVTRRLITGSYLRRNPGVEEGYRFPEPKMEYFFKDDANHDPQWSREQILSAKLSGSGVIIGEHELNEITEVALACFQILEKAWASRNCVLVDMKVEFGITKATKEVVLADVIDNDSWRLWPAGDKRLMRDKQVYRNLKEVTSEAMVEIKKNYAWVAEEAKKFSSKPSARAVILMGSSSDTPHCTKIANYLKTLGVPSDVRVSSAHKGSEETLRILHYYESHSIPTVFIAVAGRSNGLGPVLAGNTSYPVINCPPIKADWGSQDIWSSLRLPSGLGCTTIVDTEGAALAAAQILGMTDHNIWCKLRGRRLNFTVKLMHDDKKVVAENNK
ncbi:multifunctional protein ADE2-like [Hydractinia symbiolongicarpus]|uniref:multifunctional protein ADE2-like n=1 Tax=Hydractinia symbiolongicarpus TaxID=13093 RepID=UPI00254F8FE5|nr:multifunctional protein ADE2-like [Hydractinia symbiolongicarpus]